MTDPQPEQRFRFGPWTFAIHTAQALIAAAPRPTTSVDATAWATAYGLTRIDNNDPRAMSLIGPAVDALDRAYAMTTDLTKPVIVAQIAVNEHPPAPLLIDDTHLGPHRRPIRRPA